MIAPWHHPPARLVQRSIQRRVRQCHDALITSKVRDEVKEQMIFMRIYFYHGKWRTSSSFEGGQQNGHPTKRHRDTNTVYGPLRPSKFLPSLYNVRVGPNRTSGFLHQVRISRMIIIESTLVSILPFLHCWLSSQRAWWCAGISLLLQPHTENPTPSRTHVARSCTSGRNQLLVVA